MSFFQWVYYWLFFGWLFDDGDSTVTKEDTVDDYCSDESPYRDYGSPSMSDEDNEESYRGSYGGSDVSYDSYSGGSSYSSSDSSYSSSSSSDF